MEYSIEQIKDLYCKFNCKVKHNRVMNEDDEPYFNFCHYCQIDNFILELRDHKIINS